MKKLLAIAALLGSITFWACHLGPEDKANTFDVVGDTAWTHCDTLEIVLLDEEGRVLDTLFRDSLAHIHDLKDLPADKYPGGKARVRIKGFFTNGDICVDQTRSFDDGGTPIKVDTVKDPSALPDSLVAEPASLSLVADGASAQVKGKVMPLYADQGIFWSMDGSGIASLDVSGDTAVGVVTVKPLSVGEGFLTLKSRKDPTKARKVKVRVGAATPVSVTLDNDSLTLYVNGPKDSLKAVVLPHLADQAVAWSSADPDVAQVDSAGRVTPGKEGRTVVRAVTGNGKRDSADIVVIADVPRLTLAHVPGAAVNVAITFSPTVVQKVGHLVHYSWDLQGDGTWDDSLAGPWHGDSVDLPAVAGKYASEGIFHPKFRVRDSEGNTATAEATVDIGNQAPEIVSIRKDTTLSIKDSIPMTATVRDLDGKVAWVGWDYEGDGLYDDTLVTADTLVEIELGHRYHEAGNYPAILKAMDGNGKIRLDTVLIKVEFDAPVADLGNDTTVLVNADIPLSVKGSDKHGPIVQRELKIGDGPFIPLSKQDTTVKAPGSAAVLTFVGRVTDNDGLTDTDTLQVTVILSANADLAGLVFTGGDLVPAFKPTTGSYTAQVAFADSLVRVTPTAKDPGAILSVNAKQVASGTASEPVKLQVGANNNAFQILVTAPDGSQRIYSVSVARNPNAEATLKSLTGTGFTLKPAFSSTLLDYLDTVASTVASITLRPTVASIGATVAVNDTAIASGTPTGPLALAFGDNLFQVAVTAMDGASKTTYKVKIVRRAKLVIFRKLGAAAAVAVDSAELPLGVAVPISSPGATGHAFSRWSLLEGTAAIADSAANPTSLTLNSGLAKVQAAFALNRYSITGTVTGCGSMNPPGQVTVDHGTPVNYTLSPSAGCRIASVKVDGVEDSSAHDGTYSFGPVTANHAMAATFIAGYTLTATIVQGQGTVTPDSVGVDSGQRVEFVFKPSTNPPYRFLSMMDNGQDAKPTLGDTAYELTGIDKAHALEIRFLRRYTVTVTSSGPGTVSGTAGAVDSGSNNSYMLLPATGAIIKSLTVDGTPTTPPGNNTIAFNGINADHSIAVAFVKQFAITTSFHTNGAGGGLGGSISPVSPKVDSLASQAFSITANSGYRLLSMLVNGGSVTPAASYTFPSVTADQTLHANFWRTFPMAGRVVGGGTITPADTVVDSAGSVTFRFHPLTTRYRLTRLSNNGDGVALPPPSDPVFSLSGVKQAHVCSVYFVRMYKVEGIAETGGTLLPALDTLVDSLSSRTFTATPQAVANRAGYRVDSVFDNGVLVPTSGFGKYLPQSYTMESIAADHTVRAKFKRYFILKASVDNPAGAAPPGAITPDSVNVDEGASQTYTMTAATGYELTGLTDNGVSVLGSVIGNRAGTCQFTLSNLSSVHTLVATFTRRAVLLTVVSNVHRTKDVDTVPQVGISNGLRGYTIGDSVEVKLLSGTERQIVAMATFDACKLCGGTLYFHYWNLVPEKGEEKRVGSENPMTVLADDDYKYRAIYLTTPPMGIQGLSQGVTESGR